MLLRTILASIALTTWGQLVAAQTGSGSMGIKQDEPLTGTSIKREIAKSTGVPFDKEWNELSREQQRVVRGEYDNLPEDSEPPFPIGGIRSLYGPIAKAYQNLSARIGEGEILMLAYIDAAGRPTKIEVYKTVDDKQFTAFAASTIMSAKFKPAICKGSPCAMPYVVTVKLERR